MPLGKGGSTERCVWLKDRDGISWQIIPHCRGCWAILTRPRQRVMQAMLGMVKIDVAALEKAHRGE